jgi:c(7)-type cytochrome triheme protein
MKSKHVLYLGATLVICLFFSLVYADTFGTKKKRQKPEEFGTIVLNNFSEKKSIGPVVFKHWLHRSKYTCRLCHVDIGFAMKAGDTGITENDNKNGMYCGACHNGKEAFPAEERRSNGELKKNCDRCHSFGKKVEFKYDFYEFRKALPQERFGNGIDWIKAEDQKLVTLKDQIEGISIKRKKLTNPKEEVLSAKIAGMPNIIFSHKKHAVWNGCELCHPELFGVKKGQTVYSMQDLFNGKYCGACHGSVAFPNDDCQRCHTEPVS